MSSAYQKVANTRPRVRRDVLFTRTEDGVLFHNATGGFQVTSPHGYRLATLIVPHLDGTKSVAEICSALPERQRDMVARLVGALSERGFARDVPLEAPGEQPLSAAVAERFAAQINYLDHYADRAPHRFAGFRDCTVAVLGTGPVASACVNGLIRNGLGSIAVDPGAATAAREEASRQEVAGCPVAVTELARTSPPTWAALGGATVVVVAGEDTSASQTHALLAAGVPPGVSLLPAWTFGDRVIVGPTMGDGLPSCWCCAALRLTADDTAAAANLWSAMVVPTAAGPPRPLGRPLAAMVGNLLAYEVFRLQTGALPAETTGKVLVQNIDTLDVLSESLLPHPACPFCPPPGSGDSAELADLCADPAGLEGPEPVAAPADADPDEAAVAELNRRSVLVQPHVGVFKEYADEVWTQTPVKIGSVSYAGRSGAHRTIHAYDLHHVAGARRRALLAAAVSYTGQLAWFQPADRHLPRIPRDRLLTAAGSTEPDQDHWVAASSLLTGSAVAVPAAAVEPFGPANRARGFEPTIGGSGAGASTAEAVRQGLRSALAYQAVGQALAGHPVGRVRLDAVADDPERTFLVKSAMNLSVDVELLDLTPVAVLPVMLARCHGPDGRMRWEVAADPSPRQAVTRVLCDLIGRVQIAQQVGDRSAVDGHDPLLSDFDPGSLAATEAGDPPPETGRSWSGVLEATRTAGYHPYVTRVGGADLRAGGIEAVRVLIATGEAGQ